MLSENNAKWIVDETYDDVCKSILRIRVGWLLFAEVDEHALKLFGL
jgi:hypothetical protein